MKKLEQDREDLGQAYDNLQKASGGVNKTNTAFGHNLEKFPRFLHDLKRHVDSSKGHIKECEEVASMFSGHVERLNGFAKQSDELVKKARAVVEPFTEFKEEVPQSQLVVLNQVTEISASICELLAVEKAQTKETLSSCAQQCDKMDTSVRSMDEMRGQLQIISEGLSDRIGKMDHRSSEAAKEHRDLNALIVRLSEVCKNLNRARIALQEKMSAFGLDNQRVLAAIGDAAAEADRALNAKARTLKQLESDLDRREKGLAGREIVIQTQSNLFVNWCAPIVDFFLSLRLFGWVR
jgi:ABC-type transporter Mla subunit MlaD